MKRAEEFLQLFNQVEKFLSQLVNPKKNPPFADLVDSACKLSSAVKANSIELKQFAKLRNAIVHDAAYPPHIIAVPSQDTLERFTQIVQEILTPESLLPTFAAGVHCFSLRDTVSEVVNFMRAHDFSQVVVRGDDQRICMLSVEGITKWLADNLEKDWKSFDKILLADVIGFEPPGSFIIMGSSKTIFDASDAFINSIHRDATRLYAIIITENGVDKEEPIGFVTPWDLVHNSHLQ